MKLVHRIHRLFGSVFALLMAMWFVSGGIMTVVSWPAYEEHERLASAPLLTRGIEPQLPPFFDGRRLESGQRPRLAMLEGRPTWLVNDEAGVLRAYLTHAPWSVSELDRERVIAEAEARTGERVQHVARVEAPDQWTVSIARRKGLLPLYRVSLDTGRELYLSATTAEIVQESARAERAFNWMGSIPHWLYFTALRPHQPLWSNVCLVLATLGLLVSLSGIVAGFRLWWLRRAKGIRRPISDRRLRWHQRIGLLFGLLVNTWMFSGALSVHPFDWTGDQAPSAHALSALYATTQNSWQVGPALARCQQKMEVRELELASLAGRVYAVCYDGAGATRIVDLETQIVRERLDTSVLTTLAAKLGAQADERDAYDAYYFPRERGTPTQLPYWRLTLHDERDSILYVEPARGRMARHWTRAGRRERWLYHGLHTLDIPGLYEHRALWRTLMITAMSVGTALSLLGFAMTWRKLRRRAVRP